MGTFAGLWKHVLEGSGGGRRSPLVRAVGRGWSGVVGGGDNEASKSVPRTSVAFLLEKQQLCQNSKIVSAPGLLGGLCKAVGRGGGLQAGF